MSDIVVITFVVYNPCIVLPKGLKPISKRYVRLLHSDIYIYYRAIGQDGLCSSYAAASSTGWIPVWSSCLVVKVVVPGRKPTAHRVFWPGRHQKMVKTKDIKICRY